MIMANGSPLYEWQFDCDDNGLDVSASYEEPVDFEALFNSVAEKSRGDYSENRLADPTTSTADPLAFPFLQESEASTSMAFNSSVTEKQEFNFGFEKLESHQDVNPWLANHQDFSPFSNHVIRETNCNDIYGSSNGNHQLMDTTDRSYQTLEFPENMDLSEYAVILHDSLSVPYTNEPFYFGSSLQNQSLNHNDGMLLNVMNELDEHLMQYTSRNIGMHYQTVAAGSNSYLQNETHDASVLTNIQNCAEVKTNDEQSSHQVPSQDICVNYQKSDTPLPDNGLAVPLLKHQRIALSWMSKKETKSTRCCGGILADDQGLGKTISAIALILKERSPPFSNLTAIKTKDKETETLNLDEDEDEDEVKDVDSCVKSTKTSLAAGTLVVCPTSVLRQWNDELQNKVIKEANLSVLIYYGVNRTKDPFELAKYDVVITTYAIVSMEVPKQPLDEDDEPKIKLSPTKKRKYPDNEISELINRPLAKLRWFRVILDEAQSIKNYKTQAARACWGLRAKRRWCLSGTPIQNSVDDLYSYFRFLRYDPFAKFKSFCSKIKAPIQRNPVAGYKKLQVILKTIMLRRTKGTRLKGEPIISLPPKNIILRKVDFSTEERGFYRSLESEYRAQFEEYAAAGTVKQNYINILFMLLRLRQACDHPLLVKEGTSTTNGRLSPEKAKDIPQEKLKSLLNCLEASLAICSICNDPPEDAVVTTCEHVFCNQCILEHLSGDDSQCPFAECKELLSTTSSVFCKSTLKVCITGKNPNSEVLGVDSLKIEAAKALESSKIKAAIGVLESISKPKEDNIEGNLVVREKAIVFSQWTRMLDLVEVCLKDSSIGYRRLDGTMSVVARDKAVKDFNTLPEVTVMIMSLKAASLGLNMVAACHVILLDLWWNPTTEDQAIDRAHRIGQTRPVTVFRFTVKDTVEDRILALQKKKREMVASAFGDDKNGGSETRLTVADMKYLFQA